MTGETGRLSGVALIVLVLATMLVGCGSGDRTTSSQRSVPSSSPSVSDTPAPAAQRSGARSVPAPGGSAAPVAAGLRPVRITIPAIDVNAAIGDLGIARDGTIQVPSEPARAGWLTTTPAPGQRGPAVIAGHVDSTTGPAVFYRLRDLRKGDAVIVTRANGSQVRFIVDGLGAYPKNRFPTQATYGPVPGPALRLITCGGSYVKSRGGYLDNVVVFAT